MLIERCSSAASLTTLLLCPDPMSIALKRVYEPCSEDDGYRVLIDRIWPRGVRKDEAEIDLWLRDVAPSAVLRRWFSHDPDKWDAFRERYASELSECHELLIPLARRASHGRVTLVYASKEERFNNAVALKGYLERHFPA